MSLKRVLTGIFPPPRMRVSAGSAITPVVFLAVFGALLAVLRMGSLVRFSNPEAFWLLGVVPYLWWLHVAGFGTFHRVRAEAALAVRLVATGLLVLGLADPSAVRKSDRLSVMFALDVSDSIGEAAAGEAMNFVLETVKDKPARDEAGLVAFGRDAGVELPPRTAFPYEALNLRIGRDGTHLEKALRLAAAVSPEGQPARIVLISDGVQTEGNVLGFLDELAARGIAVDVLPVQYDFADEVWLERLDLPRHVKHGETYDASILLSSLRPGKGNLVLRENGRVVFQDRVEFEAGKNRFQLPIYLRENGYYEYAASIEVPGGLDGRPENNTAVGAVYLEGKGKVLVVTDPAGHPRDWGALVKALRRSDREVEVMAAYSFPSDPMSLLPYHAVVFYNVPADEFPPAQQVALHDAVFNFGTGFCMVGGGEQLRRRRVSPHAGGEDAAGVHGRLPEKGAAQGSSGDHSPHLRVPPGQHLRQAHHQVRHQGAGGRGRCGGAGLVLVR